MVALAAAAPFLLAQAATPALVCPLREATGVPCPLCGATRAFRLAGEGDLGFLRFGGWWVLLALVALAGGLLVFAVGRRPRLPEGRALLWSLVAVLLVVPWAWALAARDAIV